MRDMCDTGMEQVHPMGKVCREEASWHTLPHCVLIHAQGAEQEGGKCHEQLASL
jgi:hypothetical protein